MKLNMLTKRSAFIFLILSCANIKNFTFKNKPIPENMDEYFEKGDLSFLKREKKNFKDIVGALNAKNVYSGKSPIDHLAILNNKKNIDMIFRLLDEVRKKKGKEIVYEMIKSSLIYKSKLLFSSSLEQSKKYDMKAKCFDEKLIDACVSVNEEYIQDVAISEKEYFDFMIFSLNVLRKFNTKTNGQLNKNMIEGISSFLNNLAMSCLEKEEVFDLWKEVLEGVNEKDKKKIFESCNIAFGEILYLGPDSLEFGLKEFPEIINKVWLESDCLIEFVENNPDTTVFFHAITIFERELNKDKENQELKENGIRFNLWDFLLKEKTIRHLGNRSKSTVLSVVNIILQYIEEPKFHFNIKNSFLEKGEMISGIEKLIEMLKDYHVSVAGYNYVESISKEVKQALFANHAHIVASIQSKIEFEQEYKEKLSPLNHLLTILSEEIFKKFEKSKAIKLKIRLEKVDRTKGKNDRIKLEKVNLTERDNAEFSYVISTEVVYNYMFKNISCGYAIALENFIEDIKDKELKDWDSAGWHSKYAKAVSAFIVSGMYEGKEEENEVSNNALKEYKSIKDILENIVIKLVKKKLKNARESIIYEGDESLLKLYLSFADSITNLELIKEKSWWELGEVSNKFTIVRNCRERYFNTDKAEKQSEDLKKKRRGKTKNIEKDLVQQNFDSKLLETSNDSKEAKGNC